MGGQGATLALARAEVLWRAGPYYHNQAPWSSTIPELPANAWDKPQTGGNTTEEEWKEYAICIGRDGRRHSLGYAEYGIFAWHMKLSMVEYWVSGGHHATGVLGQVRLRATHITPLPGGLTISSAPGGGPYSQMVVD